MVWKYYGYPTLDDLYADVVGNNADYTGGGCGRQYQIEAFGGKEGGL